MSTLNHRGFMLDLARCQENRAYYRAFIDFIAARGQTTLLWHFTDDQGCALQFDCIPQLASPHAYSKGEMRELIAYAAERGVEIVPELASLGHARYITRLPQFAHLDEADSHFTGMCPVSDETRQIFTDLIRETAELFPSPNFHVGLDEVNIGGHPLTREALKTRSRGALLADYAEFIHGVVRSAGKRMWMWGDGMLQHSEMMQRLSRDIVVCNWQYAPEAGRETTQTFLDAGFDVMLCSAMISHDQTLFPGERFALPNVQALQNQHLTLTGRGKVIGHLNTIWTPVRFLADSLWLGIDRIAGMLRGEDVSADQHAKQFAVDFYGLPESVACAFAGVAALLQTASPKRSDWLAVILHKRQTLAQQFHTRALAAKWSSAWQTLEIITPSVERHADAFASFKLLIELLACTYTADGAESDLPAVIDDGERLLRKLDRQWDRERFSDDPRKYVAPIASFQADHLVPLLAQGIDVLKERHRNRSLTAV